MPYDWEIKHFENKEQLFEYVSASDYMKSDEKKGVCYGFEMIQENSNEKEWTMKIFLNDQSKLQ